MRRIAGLMISLVAGPAAGDISLALPVDCTLGVDCYIQQGVDHDPTGGISDFLCGSLTYDGHKGTDFALHSLADLAAGVAVIAAADGVVTGTRNDMADALQGVPGAPDVTDRECGNGLVLRHDDGWETQYCHLASGSVTVTPGQQVSTGDTLGFIGLSGETEFPHLHLSVRHQGAVVDPFDPDGLITCGAPSQDTLWASPVAFESGGLIAAGFANAVPDFDTIKAGAAGTDAMPTNTPALVLWGHAFGTLSGDEVTITITGPDGLVHESFDTMDRNQAQMFRAAGRRTPQGGWPAGRYTGEVVIRRAGQVIDRAATSVTLN